MQTAEMSPAGLEPGQTGDLEKRSISHNRKILDSLVKDPQIMGDVRRILAGHTRDIRLQGELAVAFRQRTRKHTASVIRSWMISIVVLDLFMLFINLLLLPRDNAIATMLPGGTIMAVALGIASVWRKPYPQAVLSGVMLIGMLVILLGICWIGVAAGGVLLDRYLHIMLCVAITGIVIFSIPFPQTLAIGVMAMVIYLVVQLCTGTDVGVVLLSVLFFGSGMAATLVARRSMNILAYKSFLHELRDCHSLTELSETNRRLQLFSMTDGLTGAANRHFLRRRVEELWKGDGQVAVLMCDIDDFKALNDCLGHHEGDKALAEVARVIAACTRSNLDCVARYGGEEFLVLLPDLDVSEAVSVAERIRGNVFAASLPNPGSQVKSVVTLSVGVASGYVASTASETLQERADAALYLAKRSGKNQVRLWNNGMSSRGKFGSVA